MYTKLIKKFITHTDEKEQVKKNLLKFFPKGDYKRLLEVGCGTGILIETLLPYFDNVTSIDIERRILDEIADLPKINFIQKDFLKFETEDRFDCLLLAYVLWEIHPLDWPQAFRQIKKLLADNGFVIVIDVAQPTKYDNWFFDFNTGIVKPDFVKDFPQYLTVNGWQFEKNDFMSKIQADTVEEMYEILKFFFQGEKRENFYAENKERIFIDLKNKIVDDKVTIKIPHEMYIMRLK